MNNKKFFLTIIFACFVSNIQAQKNQKYALTYNFKKGVIYYVEVSAKQHIKMMRIEMPQNMIFGADFEVLEVDAKNNAILKMTYTRVKFEQDNPQIGKLLYDSNSKDEPTEQNKTFADAFRQVLGKYITMKMKPTGEIMEVIDGDEALKASFKKDPNFATYPTKKLKIGDSWIFKQEKNVSGVDIVIETKMTLKDVKDGQFFLEGVGKMKDKKGKKLGNMTTKSTLNQSDIMVGIQKTLQKLPNFPTAQGEMDLVSEIIVDATLKK